MNTMFYSTNFFITLIKNMIKFINLFPNSKLQTTSNLHTYLHILFSVIKDLDLYIRSTGCRTF